MVDERKRVLMDVQITIVADMRPAAAEWSIL